MCRPRSLDELDAYEDIRIGSMDDMPRGDSPYERVDRSETGLSSFVGELEDGCGLKW